MKHTSPKKNTSNVLAAAVFINTLLVLFGC